MVSPFAVLLVFAVTGSAYCRSVPLSPINPQATDINVQFSVPPLVRLVRQTGKDLINFNKKSENQRKV